MKNLRADDQDVRRLRGLAEEFRDASDLDALRRTDSRFHIGLGVAAQSRGCSPIFGPQNPAQETTMSAGKVPCSVMTPVTRSPVVSMPVTV